MQIPRHHARHAEAYATLWSGSVGAASPAFHGLLALVHSIRAYDPGPHMVHSHTRHTTFH